MPDIAILEDGNLTPDWLRVLPEYRGPATPPYIVGGMATHETEEHEELAVADSENQEQQITTDLASTATPGASSGPRAATRALRGINPITGIDDHVEQFRLLEAEDRIREVRLARDRHHNSRMAHQQANADTDHGLEERVDDISLVEDLGEEDPLTLDPTQDPYLASNLKEISSLASWQVSTCKPNCGVEALRSHSPAQFWQSDGPQPHLLTIHFHKWVKIVKLRVYLDFLLDESYTPTRMTFWGGTGLHDLIEFYEWRGEEPRGWVDVDLDGCGPCGKAELRAFIIQVRVLENHQNGKDTHVRGVQVFARDKGQGAGGFGWEKRTGMAKEVEVAEEEESDGVPVEKKEPGWPSWMDDPIIR